MKTSVLIAVGALLIGGAGGYFVGASGKKNQVSASGGGQAPSGKTARPGGRPASGYATAQQPTRSNKTASSLREVLAEMQAKRGALARMREELAAFGRTASGNGHLVGKELRDKRQAAEELATRRSELLAELTSFGCELKGLDQGLIDFPAERDGRTVYLCWRLGESPIAHWHDVDAGYAGRQPL